jgi:hypothetical protein
MNGVRITDICPPKKYYTIEESVSRTSLRLIEVSSSMDSPGKVMMTAISALLTRKEMIWTSEYGFCYHECNENSSMFTSTLYPEKY